jgi:hypothetical protein
MPRFGKQKNLEKKLFLFDILKATDEKSRIRNRNSVVPGYWFADQDLYQYWKDGCYCCEFDTVYIGIS